MQIENKRLAKRIRIEANFFWNEFQIFNSFRFEYFRARFGQKIGIKYWNSLRRLRDVFLFGITYRGIFLLEDYFEYHGDLKRVEKMVLSWQEFETRSTSSRREGIAVINIVAAHFHVLLSSLIINSKPRARRQKDASTRAWNPLRRSENHAIPSFVRTSTAAFPRCYANERASKTKTILGRASTESYYDLEFADEMRIEYLYVLQATLTRNEIASKDWSITWRFSNAMLIRLSEYMCKNIYIYIKQRLNLSNYWNDVRTK